MKHLKSLFASLFFVTIGFSQTNWTWRSPLPTGNDLNCIIWTGTQYIGNTVKRDEIKPVTDDIMRIRLELPSMNGRIERVEQSQVRMEKTIDRVEGKIDDGNRKRR